MPCTTEANSSSLRALEKKEKTTYHGLKKTTTPHTSKKKNKTKKKPTKKPSTLTNADQLSTVSKYIIRTSE